MSTVASDEWRERKFEERSRSLAALGMTGGGERQELESRNWRSEERFIAQKARDGATVLSTQADRIAGAMRKEKASACCVRNDAVGGLGTSADVRRLDASGLQE
jgi:hypothetical protein